MAVGQAPIININTKLEQASSIHMDSPNSGGFWHGARGRLLILALILVIVAAAVAVPLVLVLGEETPPQNSTQTTTPPEDPEDPEDANGVCDNAELLAVDGMVTVGSNVNGSYVLACDTAYYGGTQFNGPSAWYKFIGTGRPLTVSTCTKNTTDFATVVSVLSSTDGTCGDDKLECLGAASGSDGAYYSGCATPDTGSMVTIDSVAGTTCYASVIGYGEDVGSFGLSIFDDTPSRRRNLARIALAPAHVNEDIGGRMDGSFAVNQGAENDHGVLVT
jgi:hypothetical protein